ncbi:MAG: sulfatase-like hydrolase/transferase [Verrucomicrobiales bacterium]
MPLSHWFRFLALAAAGATLTTRPAPAATDSPPPPHVVVIVSDDHHWRDYGFMGHPHIRTPRLDRLAAESRLFRRGYVPSSLCCPSLASIISGLYPHQHRITSNDPPLPPSGRHPAGNDPAFQAAREPFNQLMDRLPTLPRLLRAKGYVSLQTGKWWQGDFSRGGFTDGMTRGTRHGDDGLKIGRETMQPMWDFMEASVRDQKPFFLWYAPFLPHSPHNPPERLLAKYREKSPSLHIARYWAMVEWFDETCGQLLDFLDQRQLSANTLVVYVTDNGWIQDPESPRYAPRSKQSQYDGGLRTPIMLRWPGRIAAADLPHLASSIDLAPTILKTVGLAPSPEMQGVDLLDDKALAQRNAIHGGIFTHDSQGLDHPADSLRWRWIIDGHTKLILPHPANEPEAPVELYHLAADPDETTNLAPSRADQVAALTRRLDAWWRP